MDAPETTKPNTRNSTIGFFLALAGVAAFFAFTKWTWDTKNGMIPEGQRVIKSDSHGGEHGEETHAAPNMGHAAPDGDHTAPDHSEPAHDPATDLSTGRIGITTSDSQTTEPNEDGVETHGAEPPVTGH